MTHPPGPPPAAGPPLPPPGYLRLTIQGNVLLSMVTPTVTVDGYRVPVRYGENVIPVVPGPHLVEGFGQWLWRYGQAEQQVTVFQGQVVELWYAAPALTFLKGALGPRPQRIPGLVGLVVGLSALALLVVALVVGVALAG
jgi:hypothetical protein